MLCLKFNFILACFSCKINTNDSSLLNCSFSAVEPNSILAFFNERQKQAVLYNPLMLEL